MKKLRNLAISMIVAASGLLIYCGSFYIRSYEQNLAAKKDYEEISQVAEVQNQNTEKVLQDKKSIMQDSTKESSISNKTQKNKQNSMKNKTSKDKIRESFGISWENLRKINSQTVAWITVPGADISYPVVQGTDDDYYLKHNFRKEEDLFGCIFLEHNNKKNLMGSHSILYGHNIEGNMMFANLNRYEQPEFLKKCPQIEITTPKRKFLYKIFSVEQASPRSEAFTYGYELSSPAYKAQLRNLKDSSMYDTGIEPDTAQPAVTLITCNSRLDKEIRMAVHGTCYEILETE